ncbi:hypothetical protein ABT084_13685 [Streptomyces sp. NPDC002138]|uniref:hypothetical protein n=1 Tax=Streptomyces sp. NPDC002138 TaxID=3154410 RepID=UPI0033250B5E
MMKNFMRETADIRYWFYDPANPRRCYALRVHGWAMKIQPGSGGLVATGEGFPILIEQDGTLKPYLTARDFLGASFSSKEAERIEDSARGRHRREETIRIAAITEQKRAEAVAKAAEDKDVREATEKAEREAQAVRNKKSAILADADALIYGD